MSGTVILYACPRCSERHVTFTCPTCGHDRRPARLGGSHVTPGGLAASASARSAAITAILAQYLAEHPDATEASTTMLQVSLWFASRRPTPAAE